jgi:tetratricopeptide (TPR) repeat protein
MTRHALWYAIAFLQCSVGSAQDLKEAVRSAATALEPTAPLAVAQEPVEAERELERLVRLERFDDALATARRLVNLTEQQFGRESRETAQALSRQAHVQQASGRNGDAAASYREAVEILRTVEGPLTPLAIEPLAGLGDAYQSGDGHFEALATFREARSLSRRIYGLYSEEQLGLIDRMTATLQSEGRHREADELQREGLAIVTRNHPEDSTAALEAMYKYAEWLGEMRLYDDQRDYYRRALHIIRDSEGKDSVRLVEPLRALGNSYRVQRLPEASGVAALKDALEIAAKQPHPDPLEMAEVLRDLGDWAITFGLSDRNSYRRAWRSLDGVEDAAAIREEWFTGLQYVLRAPVDPREFSDGPDAPSGYVMASLTIDALGRARDAVILESVPAGLKDEAVLKHLRESRFRPQMADGEVVSGRVLSRFTFRYAPGEKAR